MTTPPAPEGAVLSELVDISCGSNSACSAVGRAVGVSAGQALALEWTASSGWSIATTPQVEAGSKAELSGVDCQADGDCIAVGSTEAPDEAREAFVLIRSAGAWEEESPEPSVGSTVLDGVSCASGAACVAVGNVVAGGHRDPALYQWNGSDWSQQDDPRLVRDDARLDGVSCVAADACLAVGSLNYTSYTGSQNLAYELDGAYWEAVEWGEGSNRVWSVDRPLRASGGIADVDCAGSVCVEVGHRSDPSGAEHAQATIWNSGAGAVPQALSPSQPPDARESELTGVSCGSPTSCAAVGSFVGASRRQALATRWNGTDWVVHPTPSPTAATSTRLNAVQCWSGSECLAVGSFFKAGIKRTLALEWDGSIWSVVASPHPQGAVSSQFADLSCPTASTCLVVGRFTDSEEKTEALVATWDVSSGAWSVLAAPHPGGAVASQLRDVSCVSGNECVGVGESTDAAGTTSSLAARWNGSSWSLSPVPEFPEETRSWLAGVDCVSSSSCRAVGAYTAGEEQVPVALEWDGSSWTDDSPAVSGEFGSARLAAVACSGEECHASGTRSPLGLRPRNLAYHLDGDWEQVEQGGLGGRLAGVSCAGIDFCAAVGAQRFDPARGDGAEDAVAWSLQSDRWAPLPRTDGNDRWLGSACTELGKCMVVGHRSAGQQDSTLARWWDGEAWSNTAPLDKVGETNRLQAASCVSSTACVAVGYFHPDGVPERSRPLIEAWDGTEWTIQSAPRVGGSAEVELRDVSCASSTACVAVGSYREDGEGHGLIERWDGSEWQMEIWPAPSDGENLELTGVSCPTASVCAAVGTYDDAGGEGGHGLIARWDGDVWRNESHPSPGYSRLSDVACLSAFDCVAVGSHVVAWNGEAWLGEPVERPAPGVVDRLEHVSCGTGGRCVATGYRTAAGGDGTTEPIVWNSGGSAGPHEDGRGVEEDPDLSEPVRDWSQAPLWALTSDLSESSCAAVDECIAVGSYVNAHGKTEAQAMLWDGASWSEQVVPLPEGASSSELLSVDCPALGSCVAVGTHVDEEKATVPMVMAWDGSEWEVEAAPTPGDTTFGQLSDVSCASTASCMAVGGYVDDEDERTRTLAMRWDGGSWQSVESVDPASSPVSRLGAVSCPTTSTCLATGTAVDGDSERVLAMTQRWDGSEWSLLETPAPADSGSSDLLDISCSSAAVCVAVGYRTPEQGGTEMVAMSWDGLGWSLTEAADPRVDRLAAVSCPSDSVCFAAGDRRQGSDGLPAVLSWNGSGWSAATLQSTQGESDADVIDAGLAGISCAVVDGCVAVGSVATQTTGSANGEEQLPKNLAYELEGGTWSLTQFAGPPEARIAAVACPETATCVAIGEADEPTDELGKIDFGWTMTEEGWAATPMPGSVSNSLRDVSCGAADHCVAVGNTPAGEPFTESWDGEQWSALSTPEPAGTDHRLRGVACTGPSSCVAVGSSELQTGEAPLAMRWNGSSWALEAIQSPSGAQASLLGDVDCTSPTACIAVGSHTAQGVRQPSIQRWDGTQWSAESVAAPSGAVGSELTGISCTTAAACTAVGTYEANESEEGRRGFVLRWNGTAWAQSPAPAPANSGRINLRDVSCVSDVECVVTGEVTIDGLEHSLVLAWDGSEWSVESSFLPDGAVDAQLAAVSCAETEECVAIGSTHGSTEALAMSTTPSEAIEAAASSLGPDAYAAGGPVRIAAARRCHASRHAMGKYDLVNHHGDAYFGWAKLVNDWCYSGGYIVYTDAEKHAQIDGWGAHIGYDVVTTRWMPTRCNWKAARGGIDNCLYRINVNAMGISRNNGSRRPVVLNEDHCIHTRIYGDGNHSRRIDEYDACPLASSSKNPPSPNPPGGGSPGDPPPEVTEPPPPPTPPTPPPLVQGKDSDVNGDNHADLVTLDGSGTVHTLNAFDAKDKTSFSTYGMRSALFHGHGDHVVDVSDVNADGRADLISVCGMMTMVCVSKGHSDHSFAAAGSTLLPNDPAGTLRPDGYEPIGVADVTGDLRGDLVTFDPAEGSFDVYPAREDWPTFHEAPLSLSGGDEIDSALFDQKGLYFVDVADVNNDGYADVVALSSDNRTKMFPGTASGIQEVASQYAPSIDPIMDDGTGHEPVGLDDVNGDGKADLVTLDPEGRIAVYAGTKEKHIVNNEYRYLKSNPVTSHSSQDSSLTDEVGDEFVGLMDRTGDGRADLVKVTPEGVVYFAPGQADLKFGSFAYFSNGMPPNRFARNGFEQVFEKPFIRRVGCSPNGCVKRPRTIESDADGDLRADLVTVDRSNVVHAYRAIGGRGQRTSSAPGGPPWDTPAHIPDSSLFDGTGHHMIDLADVNGDWHADIVSLHDNGNVYVFGSSPGGSGSFHEGIPVFAGAMAPGPFGSEGFEPIAVAYVTNDDLADLVVFKRGQGVLVHPGNAEGRFGGAISSLRNVRSARFEEVGYHFLDVVDVTGDGLGDLVAYRPEDESVRVFKAGRDGTFVLDGVAHLPLRLHGGAGHEFIGLGDVNGDRRADLATLLNGTVNVYAGRASGEFVTEMIGIPFASGSSFAGGFDSNLHDRTGDEVVGLLDENGDRRADLVTVRSNGTAQIYPGKTNFTFVSTPKAHALPEFTSLRFNKAPGHEVLNEKPASFRAGCTRTECPWPPIAFVPQEADVDEDFRADLVTVDSTGTANVFAGDRNGFRATPVQSLPGQLDPALIDGKGHYPLELTDLTDDGNADLITVKDDGKVLAHPGKDDRTFGAGIDTGASIPPIMNGAGHNEPIGVGDVTGDGLDDLVAFSGTGSNQFAVHKGQAGAKFAPTPVTSLSGSFHSALLDELGAYFLDVADVNGDKRADVVMMGSSGLLSALLGQANGQLTIAPGIAANPVMDDGVGLEPVAVGDLSGDGRADVLMLDGSGSLLLFKAQSNGQFAPPTSAYDGTIDSDLLDGTGEELIGLLDHDGDGFADLISLEGDALRVYAGKADATFEAPVAAPGEFDSVRDDGSGHELVAERPAIRRFGCAPRRCIPPSRPATKSDVDGDGRADLVTVHSSGVVKTHPGSFEVIEANSPVTSSLTIDPALTDGEGEYVVDVVDVDGDRRSDLVSVEDDGTVKAYRGQANRTFAAAVESAVSVPPVMSGAGASEPIAVADVHGDGRADLIALTTGGQLATFAGQAGATFGTSITTASGIDSALTDKSGSYLLDAGDVNGDGRADVVALTTGGSLHTYLGMVDGKFNAAVTSASTVDPVMNDGTGHEPIGLGYLDSDKRADLLTLDGSGTLRVHRGQANGTFQVATSAFAPTLDSSLIDGSGEELVGLLDYSRDGIADLITLTANGEVKSFVGQGDGTVKLSNSRSGIKSVRHHTGSNEVATEKPFRRRGACRADGCAWPVPFPQPSHPDFPNSDPDPSNWQGVAVFDPWQGLPCDGAPSEFGESGACERSYSELAWTLEELFSGPVSQCLGSYSMSVRFNGDVEISAASVDGPGYIYGCYAYDWSDLPWQGSICQHTPTGDLWLRVGGIGYSANGTPMLSGGTTFGKGFHGSEVSGWWFGESKLATIDFVLPGYGLFPVRHAVELPFIEHLTVESSESVMPEPSPCGWPELG